MNENHNPVGWFEIYVQDIERAKAFYENTFQIKLERIETPLPTLEMWMFPKNDATPGCTGAIAKMEGKDSGGGGTLIYFFCVDCSVEAERARENGGHIERPKFPIGQYGFIALILDTEGNRIGLHSMQ